MRKLAWLVGTMALLASGSYVFVYLYRWEWHRAMLVGLLFVGAEVAMASATILQRLAGLERGDATEQRGAPPPPVLARLQEAAPRRDHFAWLEVRGDRTAVFIPVLLGGGVVVSALAWVVEKLAAKTTEPSLERGLATRLDAIAFPPDGLIAHDAELLAEDGPFGDDEDLRLLLGPTGDQR